MELHELSLGLRLFLAAYPWRTVEPAPPARRRRPLSECRVGLVTSAGLVVPGDRPFDPKVRGGDWSWREIPVDVALESLEEHHRSDSFDHSGIAEDRNLALPLERLAELAAKSEIGEVAPRHASFMGSLTAVGRFVQRTVPEIVAMLVDDRVDVALLVPV